MTKSTLDPEAIALVSEKPVKFGEGTWTARRNPGELRWQVFADPGAFGPVGYLEAIHQPEEPGGPAVWQLAAFDSRNRRIGDHRKRDAPGCIAATTREREAFTWINAANNRE